MKIVLAAGVVVVGLQAKKCNVEMIEMFRGSRRRRGARHDVERCKMEDRRICG